MYWAHFINFFQPAAKTDDYVRRAARACYLPLLEIVEKHPKARLTVNIDGALAERFQRLQLSAVLDGLRRLAEKGQVELTASAYGGPILGTLKPHDIKAAIVRNTKVNHELLGKVYHPAGFFPPEMSYDPAIAPIIAGLGYRWVLMDEMGHSGKPGTISSDRVYVMEHIPSLKVVFRDRSMSTGIIYGSFDTAEKFVKAQGERLNSDHFVVTGTEADLYGMRRTGPRDFLVDMIEKAPVKMVTVSEVLTLIKKTEPATPVPASWSTWDTLAF